MKWHKEFFDKWYLDLYQENPRFKKDYIKKENAFIERVLNLPKGSKILDLCSGHGRHTISLAAAGYKMTAFDLNRKALNILRKEAKKNNLDVRIIEGDMRKVPFKNQFDAVINIFTSFGYFEKEEENLKALKEARRSLKKGGKFLLDIRNKSLALKNSFSKRCYKTKNYSVLEKRVFDKKNSQEIVNLTITDKKGGNYSAQYITKLYSLDKMKDMLKNAGFNDVIKVYGDTTEGKKYNKKSKRMVILCSK